METFWGLLIGGAIIVAGLVGVVMSERVKDAFVASRKQDDHMTRRYTTTNVRLGFLGITAVGAVIAIQAVRLSL